MWLSNFRIVLADQVIGRGALRVEDGVIAEIRDAPVAEADYEGDGLVLMPGFVDLHGDMIEREISPRPGAVLPVAFGIRELDRKLALAGVTTGFAALSFANESVHGHVRSLDTTRRVIETLHDLRGDLLVDHRVHARYEVTNVEVAQPLEALIDQGRIALVSLMDHTPGQGQYRNIEAYAASLSRAKAVSRQEADAQVARDIAKRREVAEADAVLARLAGHARRSGLTLASHDDDSPEKVAAMQKLGVAISEFPVTLEAAAAARRRGLWTLMGAPNAVMGRSMSGNLSALEAAEAGLLSMLAADYHPSAFLAGALRAAGSDEARLPEAAAMVSRNPARAAGLDDRGEIAVGRLADLVVVQMGETPRLRATFRGGRPVYSDGALHAPRHQRAAP